MTKEDHSATVLALLLGVGIGAIAALLLAPKAGEELRDNIAGAVGDGIDQLRRQHKAISRGAQKLVDTTTEQIQNALDEGDKAFKQAKNAGA